jgi:hypothetical protein
LLQKRCTYKQNEKTRRRHRATNSQPEQSLEDIEKRRHKNLPRPSKRENVIIF